VVEEGEERGSILILSTIENYYQILTYRYSGLLYLHHHQLEEEEKEKENEEEEEEKDE
jgi:hypothetical protein